MSDKEIEKEIKRYLDILSEDFQHRLNLAMNGLTGKIESAEDRLDKRISSLENNLKQEIKELKNEIISHRDNTEMHAQKTKAKKRA